MKTLLPYLLCLGSILSSLTDADTCRADDAVAYRPIPDFFKTPDGLTLGKCSAVAINSHGDIYLFHRGKQPIVRFTGSGEFVRAWGDDLIGMAHGLRIDRDGNVWATDIGHHMVYKFGPAGKLLLALGTVDRPGGGRDQFNKPTDVAFGPKDEVFVSDGYGNTRVVKFTTEGRYVTAWGTPGDQPGEFNLPHSIIIDKDHRVLVGDRENDRIQIFDLNGKRLGIWNGFAPYGIAMDSQQRIFIADGRANQVLRLKSNGAVELRIGSKGSEPGQFNLPHMLAIDKDGNMYVAEVGGERVQKFQPVTRAR